MCDTMAATGPATTTGFTLFAKNSDRERNEAQFLELLPARDYGRGAVVRATYIAIPQIARTHAVLLSRPYWIWGAEMGANEHGVVIGNEAVHPRAKPQRQAALLGMDLLRLGLERGRTAAEAAAIITGLLEAHGQGGSAGHMLRRWYDNSFIIADPTETYVLETAGRHWALERAGDRRTISNTYTIGAGARLSEGFEAMARAEGWWSGNAAFDVAAAITDPGNAGLQGAIGRCQRATTLMGGKPKLSVADMQGFLRDHGTPDATDFHPQSIQGPTICMHAGGTARRGQSVGSLVSDLRPGATVHWLTGSSAPCTSVFKPVFFDAGLPDQGAIPGDQQDDATLWWRHEQLHRALLLGDHPRAMAEIAPERDAMEAIFRTRVDEVAADTIEARRAVSLRCWQDAAAAEARWTAMATSHAAKPLQPEYRRIWTRFNQMAAGTSLAAE
jgi:secernin